MVLKKNTIVYLYLYLLLFSPILSYMAIGRIGGWPLISYLIFFSIIYGVVFIFQKYRSLIIPDFVKFAWFWVMYYSFMGMFVSFDVDWLRLLNNNHLATFFLLLMIYNVTFSQKLVKKIVVIIKVTIIAAAVVSIVQVFNSSFMNSYEFLNKTSYIPLDDIYLFRRLSIFGFLDESALGLAFVPLMSVLIGYMLKEKEKGYPLYLISGGIVALLSNTRYIMAGFIIILIQILVYNKVKLVGFIRYIFMTVVAIFILLKILSYLGYNFQEWYDSRLMAEGSLTESTRFKAFGTFVEFFPHKPLLGTGIMTEEIIKASMAVGSSHIHVGYLSHLVMYGIVGCFFLYGFWFLLMRRFYRSAKYTGYWGSFFAFLVFLFAFATMSQSSVFYYGLIFAYVFDKYYMDMRKFNSELRIADSNTAL